MEHNTVHHLDKRSPRKCYTYGKTPRKIYVLILLIALSNVAILVSLIAAHFSQRDEIRELRRSSAKAIAECRQDVALIKEKLDQQDRKNKTPNPRNIFGKSSASESAKRAQVPKNVSRREPKSKVPRSCPFYSQRRRKICLFIKKEVSRQVKLNVTELRKEIRKDIEKDMFPKVYVNLLAKDSEKNFLSQDIRETGRRYTISWNYSILHKCATSQDSGIKELCRVTRLTDKRNIDIEVPGPTSISAVKVKVAGIYFLYCQLTLTVNDSQNSKNIAHMISKVTILTSRESRNHDTEHVELISQTPVLTNQGNERLVTISMFTQAYLYKDSKVRVTISLRRLAQVPYDSMEVKFYNSYQKSSTFNVFGMYLLKKTDDQP